MKSEKQIQDKIDYEKKKQKEFAGCTDGTDGYIRLQIANDIVNVLELVLKND